MPTRSESPRPRRGRPRNPVAERRIGRSVKGRLNWEPGTPHPLDVMFGVASEAKDHVSAAVDRLTDQLVAMQAAMERGDAPDELASHEERAALALIRERFAGKKHLDHLEATLAAVRRMRLAARMEIASAAIALAADLLAPSRPSIEEELLDLINERHQRTPQQTRQASIAVILAERLEAFDQQIRAPRERLTRGGGQFESHFVTHERPNLRAMRQAEKEGQTINLDDEQWWDVRTYGPYLEYRWREGKTKYCVYLGDIPLDEPETIPE